MSQDKNKIDKAVFTSGKFEKHAAFWKEFVQKTRADSYQFLQNSPISKGEKEFEEYRHSLEGCTYDVIAATGQNAEIGMFMVLLCSLSIILYKYTGESEGIIIATPRFQTGEKSAVDQEVPIHCKVDPDATVKTQLQILLETVKTTYTVQGYPLEMVEGWHTDSLIPTNILLGNREIHTPITQKSGYDLLINTKTANGSIEITFSYNSAAFDRKFIINFSRHLEQVVSCFKDKGKLVKELSLFSDDELSEMIHNIQGLRRESLGDIISQFKKQVDAHPEAPALIFKERVWSYQSLDRIAGRIASYLIAEAKVGREDVVAIMLRRSEKVAEGILGVLMSGAAFLPVDPDLPQDRKAFMLENSDCKVLITNSEHMFDIPTFDGRILALDIQLDTLPDKEHSAANLKADQAAYIMYTSGSSGIPKGVIIEHKGVLNLALDQQNLLNIRREDRVLQFAPYTFDASIWEMFNALLSGACLVIADEEMVKSPDLLVAYTKEKKVTIAGLSASFYNVLDPEDLKHLRVIMTGGERPNMEKSLINTRHALRYNAYGCTECTVNTSVYEITAADADRKTVPIGKPISNTSVYILNAECQLTPDGFVGEMYVAGPGVARGYLQDTGLTEDKFVPNPYNPSEKLYRTGDMGRRLWDGNIEFIGRKDNQVKIRGFRVELEEVEHAILNHPQIEEAIVMAVDEPEGTSSLAVYLRQSDSIDTIDTIEFSDYLSRVLPAYMIPSYTIFLDSFPLTSNGKIDKRKLLTYDRLPSKSKVYVAPKSETEQQIAIIFSSILGRDKVSVKDNFFELGGNSLKAIAIFKGIDEQFPGFLKITDLFANSNIESIAKVIDSKRSDNESSDMEGGSEYKRIKI